MARKYRLKTAGNIRAYLSNVINRLEAGELDEGAAKARGYLAQLMSKVIESSDLEQRVQALEENGNGS